MIGVQQRKKSELAGTDQGGIAQTRRGLSKAWKVVLILSLILAASEFVARGPWRTLSTARDFTGSYLSSRAWLKGENPYDQELLDRLWTEACDAPESKDLKFNRPSVYPLTALILIAPLALWNWPASGFLLIAINVLLILLVLNALITISGLNWREPRGALFLVLGLAFAPIHTGIALGNLIIPAASSAILAIWASAKRRDILAGALIAIATGLKPHIGGIVLLNYMLERRRRVCVSAGLFLLSLAGFSFLRLEIAGVDWRQSWISSSAEWMAKGGTNDPTAANPNRRQLINLHWPLYQIFDHAWAVNSIIFLFGASLFLIYMYALWRKQTQWRELLSISALAVLSLPVIYHRFYDAVLLLLPLAWSLAAWNGEHKTLARFSFLLILPFFIPGPVVLQELARGGSWPATLNGAWWWEFLVMPHQVWAVTLLAVCLVYAIARKTPCLEY